MSTRRWIALIVSLFIPSPLWSQPPAPTTKAAAQDPATAGTLWSLTSAQLRFAQDHLVVLGRRSATEKVGRFLLSMAERACSGGAVSLAMSRLDIADYLGLTIETVSRTFTQLERQGAIGLNGARNIVIRNPAAL